MQMIEVAAGVVRRADGRVLICRRTGRLDNIYKFKCSWFYLLWFINIC